jgi:hypothetical protein
MQDLLAIAASILFFAAALGYTTACERLRRSRNHD